MRRLGKQALKAYMAAGAAALAALGNGYADDALSKAEGFGVAASALLAFGAVYFTKNGTSPDRTTSTPEV